MICLRCRQECPAGFEFCPRCGNALESALPRRSAPEVRLQRSLTQLAASPASSQHERRMITIVFCDVVSSSAMGEHLDPEEYLDVMNGAFEILIRPIQHYEGMVARLMGDAVLAFFGAPVAHEDDPERAIRAALEIVEGSGQYAARLARERGIDTFAVRIGINTGLVVVGAVGSDLAAEYTAMGDAVNLAARMQTAAPPGGILITHDTYRLVRGRFDFAPQPMIKVKGHSEPVQTYLVRRAKQLAFPMRSRGIEGVTTHMVGRDAEMAALQGAYLDAMEGGQVRVVTVLGEAGLGKSRLLDEFAAWVDLRPEYQYTWRGRATRATQVISYALLRDLFARRFGIQNSDRAAEALARFREAMAGILAAEQADLAGHLAGFDFSSSPAVRGLLGDPAFGQLAATALRQGLYSLWGLGSDKLHVRDEVVQAGAQGPVLLFLEDLHWADDASLDLIAGLVGDAPNARLLVVAAARPEFLEHRPNWGEGQKAYVRLELRPLSLRSSRDLVLDILRRLAKPPNDLVDKLVESADGNPFFLEELIKMLIEDGAIEPDVDEWRINSQKLGQVRLPPTLIAVLQARLDALPPPEKLVLRRASVVGKQFWDLLVAELAPEVTDLSPLLSALRSRELIYHRERSAFADAQEYTFEHAILREVTYESVLLQVRRDCHARVAEWLEMRAGERLGEYLALIAGHYRLAGKSQAAAGWYIRAGERAAALGSTGEARGFFETALQLLPPEELELRWRALAGHDEVLGVLGDSEVRQADDAALLAVAQQMGDEGRLAEAYYRRGHYLHVLSRHEEAVGAFDEALATAERAGNLHVRAKALSLKAYILSRLGRTAEAEQVAGEALAAADDLGDPEILARALTNVAVLYANNGDLARAGRLLARQTEIMAQVGNLVGQAIGLGNLGYYYLRLGLYTRARGALEQALVLTNRIGARRERLYNQLNLALACWRTGDNPMARRLLDEVIPQLGALGDTFAWASGQLYLGLVLEGSGDRSGGIAAFTIAHETMAAIGVRGSAGDAQAGVMRCRLAEGDFDAVRVSVGDVWSLLNEGIEGMEFPMMAYESCACAFEALGEPRLASAAIRAGYAVLMEQAGKISDPEWRQSFLQDIAEHRALLDQQAALSSAGVNEQRA